MSTPTRWLPRLDDLPRRERDAVRANCTVISVPPGTTLCRQGALAREAFVLVEGAAEVRRGGEILATVEGPTPLGEVALVASSPTRTAGVVTTTPARVAVLSVDEFRYLRRTCPGFARWVDAHARRRIADARGRGAPPPEPR